MGALIEEKNQYRDFQDRYSLFQATDTALIPRLSVNAVVSSSGFNLMPGLSASQINKDNCVICLLAQIQNSIMRVTGRKTTK